MSQGGIRSSGMPASVHADTIGAREQARDFHNLQARRLWKSENLQHRGVNRLFAGVYDNTAAANIRCVGRAHGLITGHFVVVNYSARNWVRNLDSEAIRGDRVL